ncbi:hypothetical protein VT50_0210270 [Streptomyces antioxidans]|uniref:Enoyl-CoA hydratase n=1 Tax=Streptomyces antioxidans TaxID=1507734 RepID=A0A1V4D829_9ACTN|nr:hypothetical protein VT50_0210270 [Streptomyces antioxidans]
MDCDGSLETAQIDAVNAACGEAEDAGDGTIVLVHLRPAAPDTPPASWPGSVPIHRVNQWERALRRLERSSAMTIGAATGRCGSAALELLLATDYRVATPDFSISPSSSDGIAWPGMALHRLANQLGVATARRLVLTARGFGADEAHRLGVLDEVVDDLVAGVATRVEVLNGLAGEELAIRRRLVLDATTTTFEDALGTHLAACDRTLRVRGSGRGGGGVVPGGAGS